MNSNISLAKITHYNFNTTLAIVYTSFLVRLGEQANLAAL